MSVEKTVVRYYGSPLNEFLSKKLPHTISIMNMDLVTHKYSDARGRERLRHIESKHHGEGMKPPQKKFLDAQAKRFGPLTCENFIYEEFVIYGNEPDYDDCRIVNWLTKEEIHGVTADKLLKFISHEMEFKDLKVAD